MWSAVYRYKNWPVRSLHTSLTNTEKAHCKMFTTEEKAQIVEYFIRCGSVTDTRRWWQTTTSRTRSSAPASVDGTEIFNRPEVSLIDMVAADHQQMMSWSTQYVSCTGESLPQAHVQQGNNLAYRTPPYATFYGKLPLSTRTESKRCRNFTVRTIKEGLKLLSMFVLNQREQSSICER